MGDKLVWSRFFLSWNLTTEPSTAGSIYRITVGQLSSVRGRTRLSLASHKTYKAEIVSLVYAVG